MLNFEAVSLRRGPRLLFRDASFRIHHGQHVGLTGANGCGKSSLFALIRGEIEEDAGRFALAPRTVIAHVAQHTPTGTMSAIDYVMQGDRELFALQQELARAEQDKDGAKAALLHQRLDDIDGYTAQARAARLLYGLGFAADTHDRAVNAFSGGWRMRLNLAQALMCRSDLLLLDEPTNHLDLDAVIWLEGWLQQYRGTLLLISHDRDFLDRCVQTIAHIEHQRITCYSGNYSAFEAMRAMKLAKQQQAYVKQQREIAHMQQFVERFRAKATKARQAQSRLKALERMQRIAPAHVDSPFHFRFREPGHMPNPLLRLQHVAAGYGDTRILTNLNLGLLPGDRIGLLGANGAGKSTLMKLLAGELSPLAGDYEASSELRIGYFAQHQMEQLQDTCSPLQHLQQLDPDAAESRLRSYLGGFAFRDEMATTPVQCFSGGEKARLVLALLVWRQPNLLLLDEPTNHLDLDMRHALGMALQTFAGAMVLVSHDRHLLRTVCDRFLLVADGGLHPYDGDLEDYARWLGERRRVVGADDSGEKAPDRKALRRAQAEQRRRRKPLQKQFEARERELERLLQRREVVAAELADPAIYEAVNRQRMTELTREHAQLAADIEQAEEAWLKAGEMLEGK